MLIKTEQNNHEVFQDENNHSSELFNPFALA
jgi:hypothetical protein